MWDGSHRDVSKRAVCPRFPAGTTNSKLIAVPAKEGEIFYLRSKCYYSGYKDALLSRELLFEYILDLPLKMTKTAHLHGKTVDDLLRETLLAINKYGERVKPSKGWTTELQGMILELSNPRARLSRTESRGKAFSCLGELCWYLAGVNRTDYIARYISMYKQFDENGEIFGGYGPRLFRRWKGVHQFDGIIAMLKRKRSTRQAVLQLFDAADLVKPHKDIPCTCTLQFLCRDDKLHLIAYMRSNDVIKGFPHDLFCFTMFQEIAARAINAELGIYKHCVGSLHLYDSDKAKAKSFLNEAWQSTKSTMPAMPYRDPKTSIVTLLKAESAIRSGATVSERLLEGVDPYWADLIRLLMIFDYKLKKDSATIESIRRGMTAKVYDPYIDTALGHFKK